MFGGTRRKYSLIESAGSTSYVYDDAFRITGVIDNDAGDRSWTHGYDLLDRLTLSSKSSHSVGYSYDAHGNRLAQTGTEASTYTVSSGSNRLNAVSGSLSRSYTYDAAGNTTGSSSTAISATSPCRTIHGASLLTTQSSGERWDTRIPRRLVSASATTERWHSAGSCSKHINATVPVRFFARSSSKGF